MDTIIWTSDGFDKRNEGAIMGGVGRNEVRCYLYEGERLVYEGQGWGIIIDDGESNREYAEGFVYGTHQECTVPYYENDRKEIATDGKEVYSYGENCWEPVMTGIGKPAVCHMCQKAVPEGVQALILMEACTRR